MKRTWQAVGVFAGAAGLVLGGMGLAGATGDDPVTKPKVPALGERSAATPFAPSPVHSTFTPIAPCRVVDTRASGKVGAAGRSFYVGGAADFAAQGGTSGGCGIPASATAVAANLVAVNATSGGFLKAFPAGSAAPSASVLNYGTAAIANELPLSVRPGEETGLTVTASTPTNVLVDVTGYYSPSIHVDLKPDGSVFSSSPAVTATARTGVGNYTITIDRDVIGCATSITIEDPKGYATGYTSFNNVVIVNTWADVDGDWVLADKYSSLVVTC